MKIAEAVGRALNVIAPTDEERFEKITEQLVALFRKKNADYGGTTETMYRKYGDEYYTMMIQQKVCRIESLIGQERVNFESIEDSYRDIANYAILALLSHEKEVNG